jgi:hypothetical protein
MELFKRLPTFRPLSHEEQHLIPLAERSQYPAFGKEFEILERELMPHFRKLDKEAIIHQNWYRWMYVILIFGSALVTILVIIQLAITVESIGIIGAILAAFLGIATLVSRAFKHHEHYLNTRLASEFLRSEYFRFLGRFDPYANEQDRVQKLIEQVTEIAMKGERYDAA